MSVIRAALTVGSFTMLSRITGFVREILIAGFLGAGWQADAFFVSFKLANFLRRFVAEGAFNAGFVPILSRTLTEEGKEAGARFASQALSILGIVLLVILLIAELTMPWFVRILASGFDPVDDQRYGLVVELTRITFPYLVLISIAALFSGVLNSIGKYAAAAFAPVLLNLTLISALLASTVLGGAPERWLAWGVMLAGFFQLIWVVVAAKRNGMMIVPGLPRLTQKIRRLFRLMGPAALGGGVQQISLLIDTWFATHLAAGSVAYLFFADRIIQLPVGLIGVALGTVLLPTLTRQYRSGDGHQAVMTQNRAIEVAMLLTVPAAMALMIISAPVVSVLFERGAFDADATRATALAVLAFAAGLPAYVLVKVLVPAFFAREDTKTPVKIAALALFCNIALILVLIGPLAHVGIALATAIANWVNAVLLIVVLRRQGFGVADGSILGRLFRILIASALMAAALWLALALPVEFDNLIPFILLIATGCVAYGIACLALRLVTLRQIINLIDRRKPGRG